MIVSTSLIALSNEVDAAKAAITAKGGTAPLGTSDMADAIAAIPSGGADPVINPLTVTENGTYTAPSGVDGYSPVTVNVSGGGANFWSGEYTLATREAIDVTFAAPNATHFLLLPNTTFDLTTGNAFLSAICASNTTTTHRLAINSNNAGTVAASSASIGGYGTATLNFTFGESGVRMTALAPSATSRIPQAGITYTWIAWR